MNNYTDLRKAAAPRQIFIVYLFEALIIFGAFAFASALMRDRFDLSYTHIGLLLAGYGFGGLVFWLSVKAHVKKPSEYLLLLYGGMGVTVAYLSLAFIQNTNALFPIFLLVGFGFYMFHITLQNRATMVAPKVQGTAMSLFSPTLFFGQSIGAQVLGRVIDNFSFVHGFSWRER